ncbi:MAG: glycine cleavage system protein H [Anaeromyxobacteraceae bacterium]
MTALIDTLTTIGIFVAGLAVRLGIVAVIGLLLLTPVLLALGAGRMARAARMWLQGYRPAGRLRFRDGLSYAPGHTWMKAEGNNLKVGIDDLAQNLLPWAVAVELPKKGQEVREGEPVATLSCGDRQVRIAAPASGRIVALNVDVLREPTLAKSESYGAGWLFAIEPANQEWKRAPIGEKARSWLRAEGERLERFYEHELGMAAADGGELVGSPDTLLDDRQWRALTQSFLRT